MRNSVLNLSAGEVVEVLSKEEISASLDESCRLEHLPFTPEMWRFCGKRFRILSRPERIFVEGIGTRKISHTVILEKVACDGSHHRGCARTCQLLWKEAWLKRVDPKTMTSLTFLPQVNGGSGMTIGEGTCQSANLIEATTPLFWDRGIGKTFRFLVAWAGALRMSIKPTAVREKRKKIAGSLKKTPTLSLQLQPGELVEVRSEKEILETLDTEGRNRGLGFGQEMLKFCGKQYRVSRRVEKAVSEINGEMREVSNTVILEEVTCDGSAHGMCLRNCFCLWREIWLRRVEPTLKQKSATQVSDTA